MKKILLLLLWFPVQVFAQTQTENYILSTTYKVPTTTSIASPSATQAIQNIIYFDGLGRPKQQIAHQQAVSATGVTKDIVTPIEYDAFGRQDKDYLPYATTSAATLDYKPNALTEVVGFYATTTANQEATTDPYSKKWFEASPLNRVLKQAAPGNNWKLGSGHEIKLDYQTNKASDDVKLFNVSANLVPAKGLYDIPTTLIPGVYLDFQLYKNITYDENTAATPTETNGSTVEFKNKEGQVVLKRTYGTVRQGTTNEKHDTYYVYDQFGNLTFVIPPLVNATTTITSAILDGLCYQYKYDYRNRLVEKKLPGKQWEFIVYDKLDRVVATGPALSPFTDSPLGQVGWMITKYDVFNRPVYTGWEASITINNAGRVARQNTMNGLTTISESKTTNPTLIDALTGITYYTNDVEPKIFKLLTINYYDDYNFGSITPPTSAYFSPVAYNNSTLKPKGLPTGSWVRVPTTLASTTAESSYTLYDAKARPIKTVTTNYLGGYTQTDSNLDSFSGRLNSTETRHKRQASDVELYIKEVFTYSPQERLLTRTHQIGTTGIAQVLTSNSYNELGQLITKSVGNTISSPLQKIDYKYNIRGWLKDINDTANLSQSGAPQDLFSFKISYDSPVVQTDALYNGNISETYWKTKNDNTLRKYNYYYDTLNRLKDARYSGPGGSGQPFGNYKESVSYDKNGNIATMYRTGLYNNIDYEIPIDDLYYGYNGNQLTSVRDDSNVDTGFADGNTGIDYTYDANGNMTKDLNKGIGTATTNGITYNHLNLPTQIVFNANELTKITYIYDANGKKLQKRVAEYASKSQLKTITTTDYLSGFQYIAVARTAPTGIRYKQESTNLQHFPTAEGYVKSTAGVYSYVFNYIDHLGNVRLSYTRNSTTGLLEILEESNYYPFGLKHEGYNSNNTQTRYKYKYQGQERQDELGLNWDSFKWRNYDAAIGRFMSVDPLAEKYSKWTPYAFAGNQVVHSRELEGLEPENDLEGKNHYVGIGPQLDRGEVFGVGNFLETAGIVRNSESIIGADISSFHEHDIRSINDVVSTTNEIDFSRGSNDSIDGVEQMEDFDGYGYADEIGQLANAATVVWGAAQLGIDKLRQVNLASTVGEAFGIGTQVAATRLKAFTSTLGAWGNRVGAAGVVLSGGVLVYKYANNQTISTAETVGFGIGAGFLVAGSIVAGTAAAPFVAGVALLYGAAELGSYAITGQSLEQHIFQP